GSIWRNSTIQSACDTAPPAVSYARLQGQDQLMKHFSLSAVMHDNDARKRPLFCEKEELRQKQQAALKAKNAMTTDAEPRYISVPDSKELPDSPFLSDSLAFLNVQNVGA
ncbi:unnamed protein product, partial [Polarella glacialis]